MYYTLVHHELSGEARGPEHHQLVGPLARPIAAGRHGERSLRTRAAPGSGATARTRPGHAPRPPQGRSARAARGAAVTVVTGSGSWRCQGREPLPAPTGSGTAGRSDLALGPAARREREELSEGSFNLLSTHESVPGFGQVVSDPSSC